LFAALTEETFFKEKKQQGSDVESGVTEEGPSPTAGEKTKKGGNVIHDGNRRLGKYSKPKNTQPMGKSGRGGGGTRSGGERNGDGKPESVGKG